MERKEYRLDEKIYSGEANDNTKSILESFFQEVLKKLLQSMKKELPS